MFVMVLMAICLTNSSKMLNNNMVHQVPAVILIEVSIKCNYSTVRTSRTMIQRVRPVTQFRAIKQLLLLVPLDLAFLIQTKEEIEEAIDSRINSQVVVLMAVRMLQ